MTGQRVCCLNCPCHKIFRDKQYLVQMVEMGLLVLRKFITISVSLCLLVCFPVFPLNAQNIRNVLVLHSYHQGLQWTDNVSEGIKDEFKQYDGEIEIHFEYLDTKRIPGEEYYNQLILFESFKTQLANIEFEVIISSDNNALRFIIENGDQLYPDVPVIFCGVNNFSPEIIEGKENITGIVEAIDYDATLQLISDLHPDRNKITVILDKTPTGDAIKKEFDQVLKGFSNRFNFEYYQNFILSEVPDKIKLLGEQDIIYLLTFNRDRKGTFISYVDGIKMIKKTSRVPIYGSWDFYYGHGIVGGMLTSGYTQGREAAKMAKAILNGTSVETMPVVLESPNQFMFDYREMENFNIKPSDLPKGSKLIHLPPSFIDRHKRLVLGALGAIFLVSIIQSWRLIKHRQRQKALIRSNIELDRRVAEQTKILEQKNYDLEREIKDRIQIEKILVEKKDHLEEALSRVKTLSGLLPICSSCKKIRDDKGYWNQIENYINEHSDAKFSHGICPACANDLYPDLFEDDEKIGE